MFTTGPICEIKDGRQLFSCSFCGDPATTTQEIPPLAFKVGYPSEEMPRVPSCEACARAICSDGEYTADLLGCLPAAGAACDSRIRKIIQDSRVARLVVQLARGLTLYELNHLCHDNPAAFTMCTLSEMCIADPAQSMLKPADALWPEVGSRAFQRMAEGQGEWVVIKPGRYRYATMITDVFIVRIVLNEVVAAEVAWYPS